MLRHIDILSFEWRRLIRSHQIQFGGNSKLKIYGTLACVSGKRMKRENRVFFNNELEALTNGYRPCAHCLNNKYKEWIRKNQVEKHAGFAQF